MANKLLFIIIGLFLVGIFLQVFLLFNIPGKSIVQSVNPEKIKDLANTLLNKELYTQAISEYLKYLDNADNLDDAKRTNILYMIANTYYEKLKDYENALAYYYRSKFYEPKGDLLKQINKKIVSCLEKLERSLDAKNELDNAALYSEEREQNDNSSIVAKIDDKIITMQDLNSEIEKLPMSMQSEYSSPDKKLELLNQLVSNELFYRAAQRIGLDKDKEVIAKTFEIKQSIMAQKYLINQMKDKLKLEPEDVKLYYDANKERYKTPKKALVKMMTFKEKMNAESAKNRLDKGEDFSLVAKEMSEDKDTAKKGGLLGEIPLGTTIPGYKESKQYSRVIFSLPEKKYSNIENIEGIFFIFKVDNYIPGEQLNLSEVIEQVQQDAIREKQYAEGMKLMERLSKTHEVMINENAILGISGQ